MKDGCDRVFERVFQSWIGQRLHGLSGVGIVLGDLWVVLKLEWNPLHPRTPPCRTYGAFPSLFSPISIFSSFFASTWLSQARSAPSSSFSPS